MSQFFEILNFSQDIWGNIDYTPETKLSSSGTLTKSLLSPKQNYLKEI